MVDLVAVLGQEFLAFPEEELANLWADEDALEAAELALPRPLFAQDDMFFDSLDRAKWEMAVARAMPFKLTDDRADPFNPARMYRQVSERAYSGMLNRHIATFDDAVKHAIQVCFLYHDQDTAPTEEEAAEMKRLEEVMKEEARLAWKMAIATRAQILLEQDQLVATARDNYRKARGKC